MPRASHLLRILALLLGLAATSATAPARAKALIIGVGDQTSEMFEDPRFAAAGIRYARLDIAWNALGNHAQRIRVDAWLKDARAERVAPLITFDHSSQRGWHHETPTAASVGREFRRFHARYPWVHDFAAWNEANYCGESTCHRAGRVAAYYEQMRRACPSCRILAAELLDEPNMAEWVGQFDRGLQRLGGGSGRGITWGLHNYIGANRLQSATTRALLRATSGPIWFTEVGGLVSRRNHSSIGFPESAAHAAKVTRFIFDRLVPLSPRIQRVYLYQWDGGGALASWDSGLIAPDGRVRPAYAVFLAALRADQGTAAGRPAAGG